jgi:hypothetical protein
MPLNQQYFVLYHNEGRVQASTLPSCPTALSYEGRTYSLSRYSLIDFNHLLCERTLVGFDFLNTTDGGQGFLSSHLIRDSANVRLREGTLEIHLGNTERAESDQGSFMGANLFQTPKDDFMIVLPYLPKYWSELGFELARDGAPSANVSTGGA